MEKGYFSILAAALFILALAFAHAQGSIGIALSINPTPVINFMGFVNNSGFTNENITFNFNISDSSSIVNCSLKINSLANLSNSSPINNANANFNLSNLAPGNYNASINCTNSLGLSGDSNTFAFTVISARNFNLTNSNLNLSAIDIRNVTNFTIENGLGSINFTQSLDLSNGFDLDKYVNISFNRIQINSTALSNLNKSATLQLANLTFSNPRILVDGVSCPDSICQKVSYSGGILVFNVTHFTAFSAEETPAEAQSSQQSGGSSGGGGGGGGGTAGGGGGIPNIVNTDFIVDKAELKVKLRQGETKTETLKVKNIGTSIFDVSAILNDIGKFKASPENDIVISTLSPNEEKEIQLIFKALENEKPDIYPARIVFKGPSKEKDVTTLIEVDSAEPLFDVSVDVLAQSKKVFPGQDLLMDVSLVNVRGFGRVDVVVEYSIKDLQGNVVATEHETLAVEKQAKFTRTLLVPSDLKPGTYVSVVKVIYGDSIGVSSSLFEVEAKSIRLYPVQITDYRYLLMAGIALAVLLVFSAYHFGYLKKKAPKTEAEQIKQLKAEDKSQKLKKELEALEEAHKSGFISDESYQSDRKRIEEKLKTLK